MEIWRENYFSHETRQLRFPGSTFRKSKILTKKIRSPRFLPNALPYRENSRNWESPRVVPCFVHGEQEVVKFFKSERYFCIWMSQRVTNIWMSLNVNIWMSISECQSGYLNVNIRMSVWMSECQSVNIRMSMSDQFHHGYWDSQAWSQADGVSHVKLHCYTLGVFKSFVMNNKAFRNLFCNPQKSFHTSPTRIIEAVNHSSNSTIAFTKKNFS